MKKITQIMFSAGTLVLTVVGSALASSPPPAPVPEPGTLILLGLGAAGLVAYKKFKK